MTTAYQRTTPQPTPSNIAYSLVIPVYNEEGNLTPLHERVTAAMTELPGQYELILVDDGSRDGSAQELAGIAARDQRVKVVQFRRNFGQTAAMSAGIDHSRGDILVFLDADLQNDPADIPRLIAKLNEGYDVVSGWRKDRQDAFITRTFPSRIAEVAPAAIPTPGVFHRSIVAGLRTILFVFVDGATDHSTVLSGAAL